VIKAYLFTNLAVIALLSTISTPCVIVLSRLFLGTHYRALQYIGATICVSGVVFFSISFGVDTLSSGSDAWLGCLLALSSALVYAGSNVLAEQLTVGDSYDSDEFLAMTGVAGLAWSVLYLLASGLMELSQFPSQPAPVIALVFLYALSIFCFYTALPLFLRRASATLFNLSLLTVNIYSALVNMALFEDSFTWSFPVALLIVTVGILVYSC
jgi:solute carrier family 35 protein F1/2